MNQILGKSTMLWKIKDVLGGDPELIADHLKEMGANSLQVKAADGVGAYNLKLTPTGWKDVLIGPLSDALEQNKIDLWGWHYLYGVEPEREAQRAAERMSAYPFKGWILDVEKEFKKNNQYSRARRFMSTLRSLLPDATIVLCSYRYPSYHREVPWQIFLDGCDFVMPQVYWVSAHNPAFQLNRTIDEYQVLYDSYAMEPLPMIPVGSAYKEWGWQAAEADITEFLDAAKNDQGLGGVSFWRHGHIISLGLDEPIIDFDWPVEPVDPPDPPDPTDPELVKRVENLETAVYLLDETVEVHGSRLNNLESRVTNLEERLADHLVNHPGGQPLPPGQAIVTVKDTHAQAWGSNSTNGQGYPVININVYNETKDPALRWDYGAPILVYAGFVDSDGEDDFYKLVLDYPVHGYDSLYVQEKDVKLAV